MKGGLLLNVVVGESPSILELLPSENQALLVRWDTLLVLDLRLDVVDRVGRLDLKSDRLSREGLDENLHPTTETQDEMEGGLLLNVVVGEGAAILELLSGEDQALLVGRDALLVLDLRLHVVDSVGRLDLKSDRLAREGLDEDLHPSTETQNQMEGRLLLNVVVRKGAAILKLLSGKDQALLVGRDALLVLDLRLHVVDGVRGLDLEGDRLASEGLNENLHAVE